ncbi:MAG: hypothetical protein RR967_00910 [Anaerovoracaceae bacterium]
MERNYLFDNLKVFLIFTVVLVHLLAVISNLYEPTFRYDGIVSLMICTFHMPLFMFVSGYLSKNLNNTFLKVKNLIVLYAVGQILIYLVRVNICGLDGSIDRLFVPAFSMWYLFSLIIFKALLPLIAKIKYPLLVIGFFLGLSIYTSAINPETDIQSSLLKLCEFSVFYFIGYYTTGEQIAFLKSRKKLPFLLVIGASIISMVILIEANIIGTTRLRLLFLRDLPTEYFQVGGFIYLLYIYTFFISVSLGIAIIALFPAKENDLSQWGRNTSLVYICQAMLFFMWREEILDIFLVTSEEKLNMIAVLLSFLCVIIFGEPHITRWFSIFLNFIRRVVFLEFIYMDRKNKRKELK